MVDRRSSGYQASQKVVATVGAASAVGSNIRARRLALGLSMRGLSARVGIAHSSLRQIEIGASRPRPDLLERLCRALDITLNDLQRIEQVDADPFAGVTGGERAALLDYLAFLRWNRQRSSQSD